MNEKTIALELIALGIGCFVASAAIWPRPLRLADGTVLQHTTTWYSASTDLQKVQFKQPDFGGNLKPGDKVYALDLETHEPATTYMAMPSDEHGVWFPNPNPLLVGDGVPPMFFPSGDYLIDVIAKDRSDGRWALWSMTFHVQ